MATKLNPPKTRFPGNAVPMREIRKSPSVESDVDLLVVMSAKDPLDQAFRIRETIDPPFDVHVVVRTPYNLAWRLKEKESFLTEVMTQGKVLYEKTDI